MKKITHSREKKQPKVKVEMTGTGLTIYGELLPAFNFMKALKFREKVWKEVGVDREANARYEMVDAIEMIVIGLMTGATAMEQMVTIWNYKVLQRVSGWKAVPVATTLSRIIKLATPSDIIGIEGLVHYFRGRVWKRAVR